MKRKKYVFSRLCISSLLIGGAALFTGCDDDDDDNSDNGEIGALVTYIVTVQNVSNQPMGPVATATHTSDGRIWATGSNASAGVKQVAEVGNPMALVGEMLDNPTVTDVANSGAPMPSRGRVVNRFGPFANGGPALTDTQTFEIDGRTTDRLSMASMLIGTNDGFWGLDSVKLPSKGTRSYTARGYDAGTEENDELQQNIDDGASILGPEVIPGELNGAADNGRVGTDPVQPIRGHPGISGRGDIPNSFRFGGGVAKVTVTVKEQQ
jgi:hypothetical protein